MRALTDWHRSFAHRSAGGMALVVDGSPRPVASGGSGSPGWRALGLWCGARRCGRHCRRGQVVPDTMSGDPSQAIVMHADGAGTKSSLAYMYWKKTGDLSVWKGIAQDAIVMNLDDLLCVGVVDNILLSSTIGRNKNLIPREVIAAVINGTEERDGHSIV